MLLNYVLVGEALLKIFQNEFNLVRNVKPWGTFEANRSRELGSENRNMFILFFHSLWIFGEDISRNFLEGRISVDRGFRIREVRLRGQCKRLLTDQKNLRNNSNVTERKRGREDDRAGEDRGGDFGVIWKFKTVKMNKLKERVENK